MPHYNNPHRNTNAQGMNRHADYARYRNMNAPRSAAPPELPSVPQYYPGVNPYGAAGTFAESSALVPYNAAGSALGAAAPAAAAAETATSAGLLSNLGSLKGVFDRLGGIDGIMGHIGRVQKVIGGFQQFAPMAKLLMGSFLPGAKGAAGVTTSEPLDEYRPPRRRKSSGSGKRRSSGSKGSSSRKGTRRSSSSKRRSSSRRR
ncbi:hypothetical protein [Paenibacillus physcomitrellae]|uniref:Tyrosine protein kinase n=2 Tax=Paenibacillus physcomitrellae TaxID=1619311 RepID=A0ABQ1GX14_9BACL|nr:hypothetical protein [Paenibacillus physcomitrellae]GGA52053.1 hypothetical protein GCM10010917_41610 [Paenibacillus physcomitrellae]